MEAQDRKDVDDPAQAPPAGPALELLPTPTEPGPAHPGTVTGASAAATPSGTPGGTPQSAASMPSPGPAAPDTPTLVDRLPWWTVPAILVGIPVLIALLAQVWPTQVYDRFVWQYYWGPIRADAENVSLLTHNGIVARSGYNKVNTASWALLMGLCILAVAQILRRTRIPMDARLILGATGWVVAGSVFHVMEDVALFAPPLQYLFITPPIYLLFAAFGVLSFGVGLYLQSIARRANVEVAIQKMWMLCAIPVIGYLMLYLQKWSQVQHYVNPIWVTVFALVSFLLASRRARRTRTVDPTAFVGQMSIAWILLSLAYVAKFIDAPWFRQNDPLTEALWAVALAAGVCLIVLGLALVAVGRAERAGRPKLRDYAHAWLKPINLLLLFSQMLDAFATSIGIDSGRYHEKHVLSGWIIERTRDLGHATGLETLQDYPTFVGFASVKLIVSLFVVYGIDVAGRDDADRNPTLVGLVKFAIIMVGLGPGIRNLLRMALGV